MYANRDHLKNCRIPVRVEAADKRLLEELAKLRHMEPAALARELLLEKMEELEREARRKLETKALKRA